MEDVKLTLDEKGQGAFSITANDERLGEMVVSVSDAILTVYHTEVSPKAEGKGLAKTLLNAMVDHARTKDLKVKPLCPYVHAQFKRRSADYADVWYRHQAN